MSDTAQTELRKVYIFPGQQQQKQPIKQNWRQRNDEVHGRTNPEECPFGFIFGKGIASPVYYLCDNNNKKTAICTAKAPLCGFESFPADKAYLKLIYRMTSRLTRGSQLGVTNHVYITITQ